MKRMLKLALAAAVISTAFGVPTFASADERAANLDGVTIITGAIRDSRAAPAVEADDSALPALPVVYDDQQPQAAATSDTSATQQSSESSASGADLSHRVETQ